jgi:hypothetical protein
MVTITPKDDPLMEGEDTVILSVVGNSTYTVGTSMTATVTIRSDEVVTVTATDAIATEGGSTKGLFTFTPTGSTASSLTVFYNISGTAAPGSDYVSFGTSVTFPAGASTVTKTVTPLADRSHELNESVILTLIPSPSPVPTYTPGSPSVARVVILNEDPFPQLR